MINKQPASDIAPALAITSASSPAAALPDAAPAARRSRRYCWRRAYVTRRIRPEHSGDQASADAPTAAGRSRTRDHASERHGTRVRGGRSPNPYCGRPASRARAATFPPREDALANPHGLSVAAHRRFPARHSGLPSDSAEGANTCPQVPARRSTAGRNGRDRCDLNATSSFAACAESRSPSRTTQTWPVAGLRRFAGLCAASQSLAESGRRVSNPRPSAWEAGNDAQYDRGIPSTCWPIKPRIRLLETGATV